MNCTTNLNKYEENERILANNFFEYYKDKIYTHQFTPPKERKPYDGTYRVNIEDPSTFFEIKVRDFEFGKYPDYILEMKKLMSLSKIYDKGFSVEYWNFFNNKNSYDLIIFNLDYRINLWRKQGKSIIKKKWMNIRTFQSKQLKTLKDVVMLKYDNKIDLKVMNKGWKLN